MSAESLRKRCARPVFYALLYRGMLFVIFDVETMFLIPWAILYRGWVALHQRAIRSGLDGTVPRNPARRLFLWLLQEGRS